MDWTRHYFSFEDFAEYNGISNDVVEKYKNEYEWGIDMLEAYLEDTYGKNTYIVINDSWSDALEILKINSEDPFKRLKESNDYLLWCIQQKMEKGEKNEEWIKLCNNLKELLG